MGQGLGIPSPSSPETPTQLVLRLAREAGFDHVAIAPAEELPGAEARLRGWLEAGFAGELDYLRDTRRAHPRQQLRSAKAVLCVALPAGPLARPSEPTPAGLLGKVARYARGEDYHTVMHQRLRALARTLSEALGEPVESRVCCDSAPLLERELAARAGLGFLAKSAMLIVPGLGSHALLGELLLDLPLETGSPQPSRCGSCRACLDACPTQAFVADGVLDARRCISYLTIEYQGFIPKELRPALGTWVYGCDVCQQVCPFNRGKGGSACAPELQPHPEVHPAKLLEWVLLGSAAHRRLATGRALRRSHRHQLARNAAIALGNLRDPSARWHLELALLTGARPEVRGHAAWALGRLGPDASRALLTAVAQSDPDERVRREAQEALLEPPPSPTGP